MLILLPTTIEGCPRIIDWLESHLVTSADLCSLWWLFGAGEEVTIWVGSSTGAAMNGVIIHHWLDGELITAINLLTLLLIVPIILLLRRLSIILWGVSRKDRFAQIKQIRLIYCIGDIIGIIHLELTMVFIVVHLLFWALGNFTQMSVFLRYETFAEILNKHWILLFEACTAK